MKRPEELIVGRIYFSFMYEDEYLRYPIIHSYEYCGIDAKREDCYRFKCISYSNDFLLMKETDLEMLEDAGELVASLKVWVQKNPDLAS